MSLKIVTAIFSYASPSIAFFTTLFTCGTTSVKSASQRERIATAALEGIAYQVKELLDAMEKDAGKKIECLRVDGGASRSDFLLQFQSDILQCPIDRPVTVETTAFGAAFLAGHAVGLWPDLNDLNTLRQTDRIFEPNMEAKRIETLMAGWHKAVGRSLDWADK